MAKLNWDLIKPPKKSYNIGFGEPPEGNYSDTEEDISLNQKPILYSDLYVKETEEFNWDNIKPPIIKTGLGIRANANINIVQPGEELIVTSEDIEKEKEQKWVKVNKLGVLGNPKETILKQYTPPKENWWNKFKGIFKAKPEEQIAKAQVSYNISQKTGIPINVVNQNLDKITKDLGIRGIPTTEEMISVAMILNPLTAGLITTKPISVVTGVAKWMGLSEGVNAIVSKLKGEKYKFGAGKNIKDLLPEETNQITKDAIDILEMIGKIAVIAATDKNVMKMWDKFTKDITTEYNLPEKMYISAQKVKSIFQTGEEISPEELQLITDLGLNASQYKNAIKNGIDIEIPSTEMTTFADRPWFAKIKEFFNIKPFSETVITRAGKVKPVTGFIEGKVGIPEVPVIIPKEEIPPTPQVKVAGKGTLTPVVGTGETKIRGLSVSVETKAIADKLTEGFGDLPQYKVINAQDQVDKTAKIINSDYELAKKMALEEEAVPKDILPESMFTAVRVKAEKEGDIATIMKLATSPVRTVEATVMGQRIQALGVRDPESPVFAIQDLDATLIKANESKLKVFNKLDIPKIDESIKKVSSNKQSWVDFINSIRCK